PSPREETARTGEPEQSSFRGSERVRLRVPEVPGQAQPPEDLAHFGRLRAARLGLQASRVPFSGKLPELVHSNHRPQRIARSRAPLTDALFRPEEKHRASR